VVSGYTATLHWIPAVRFHERFTPRVTALGSVIPATGAIGARSINSSIRVMWRHVYEGIGLLHLVALAREVERNFPNGSIMRIRSRLPTWSMLSLF
jgi:hypothetical protein